MERRSRPYLETDGLGFGYVHKVYDKVVDDMCNDSGNQPKVEHQPEEHHTEEPRVYDPENSKVFVCVAKATYCDHDGSTENPVGRVELRCKCAKCEEIGDRTQNRDIEPLHETKCDPIEERQDDHRTKEIEPTIYQFFPETGVEADPNGASGEIPLACEDSTTGQYERGDDTPCKDKPDSTKAGSVVAPDVSEINEAILGPKQV